MSQIENLRACTRALVQRFGCYEAAAATISARLGTATGKGTVSKKMAGQRDFSVPEIVALEDAMGDHPVSRMLARRLGGAEQRMAGVDLVEQGGLIAKEAGEAVNAILAAGQSAGRGREAAAVVEIDEAIAALEAARQHLQEKGG